MWRRRVGRKVASGEKIMLPWDLGKNKGRARRRGLQRPREGEREGMREPHFSRLAEPCCLDPELPSCSATTWNLRVLMAGEGPVGEFRRPLVIRVECNLANQRPPD